MEAGWHQYQNELERLIRLCHEAQAEFLVALFPHAAQFEDRSERFLPQKRLARLCRTLTIPFIDPAPEMKTQPEKFYSLPDPVHPSVAGHLLLAEKIAPLLHPCPSP